MLGLVVLCIALALASGVAGCVSPTPTARPVLTVGVILGTGGLGDRSFNDSAYAGLQEAQREYGIRFKTINYTTDDTNQAELRRLIENGYDLIIGIGFENAEYIQSLSQEFPDRKFAVVDTIVEGDNVASIVYREQEGDFLMGVLAAMLTQTKIVGFVGGADIDIIRRIEGGFKQGVAYQDPEVRVLSQMAGTFSDPQAGKSLALEQYAAGADVIYNAAGRTGLGVIEAAAETGNLTIGTSGDQRYLAPGSVVGNRPKRVDMAVLSLVQELEEDRFQAGVRSLGLAEDGLGLGPFDEELVTASMLNRLQELKQQIIAGDISIAITESD
jgi:basic membrane protein A